MKRYKDFSPTPFDAKGAFIHDDRENWYVVPVSQTRDSGCLDQSNFAYTQAELAKLDPEDQDHEIHRFGHWGPGWFEIIIVRPDSPCHELAKKIEKDLDGYPVLDEDDFSQREWDGAQEYWESLSLADRVELCADNGISVFAARRKDDFPSECYEALRPE